MREVGEKQKSPVNNFRSVMMKTNSLTTAVVAGLAGIAGFANLTNAVEVNSDGMGQVLLYPYFTTNADQQTMLSVVNTADVAKVVKVRFLEGENSREVLDFNLWLSPYDVWTGVIASLNDMAAIDSSVTASDGSALISSDTSCSPFTMNTPDGTFNGKPFFEFRNFAYSGSHDDTGSTSVARGNEGHFEIISMADLVDTTSSSDYYTSVTHVNGVPKKCSVVDGLDADTVDNTQLRVPTGGLFGSAGVINVGQGTFLTYNADAIDGFTTVPLFYGSGTTYPSLAQANSGATTAVAYVFASGGHLVTATYLATPDPTNPDTINQSTGVDAVSAVLSADSIYNEYVVDSSIGSYTDWVVTFPTKRFYVDPEIVGADDGDVYPEGLPPFVELFGESSDGNSCAVIGMKQYNREEGTAVSSSDPISPQPEDQPSDALCKEVNVISFLASSNPNAGKTSGVLGSKLVVNIPPYASAGWAALDLSPSGERHFMRESIDNVIYEGLPATGFAATNYVRSDVTAGILANYSGLYRHRNHRACTVNGVAACS